MASLLAAPTQNWALDIVEWGRRAGARVDFSSSHAYSDPCGNATGLYLALKVRGMTIIMAHHHLIFPSSPHRTSPSIITSPPLLPSPLIPSPRLDLAFLA